MRKQTLTAQLRRLAVEQRPTACLGCGFEYGCSLHGCQVMKKAAELLEGKTTATILKNHGEHEAHCVEANNGCICLTCRRDYDNGGTDFCCEIHGKACDPDADCSDYSPETCGRCNA